MDVIKKHFNLSYVMVLLLAFIGGFLELYSYKTRGIYSCLQSGNLISIFVNFNEGKNLLGVCNIVAFFTFFIGCFLNEILLNMLKKKNKNYELFTLICMVIFLIVILAMPLNIDESIPSIYDIVAVVFLALFGSFQYCSFKIVSNTSYTTTMVTAMLKYSASSLANAISKKDKEEFGLFITYFLLIVTFLVGSLTFYCSYAFIEHSKLNLIIQLLPLVVLFVVLILIVLSIIEFKNKKQKSL